MITRLVAVGIEAETPDRSRLFLVTINGPAGDDARKLGHVSLIVTAIHAQRVKFHDLAGQIFVQAALAVFVGR